MSIGVGLGRPAQDQHENPDQQQEHDGSQGDDPEDDIAVDESGEEIPEKGEGVVVNLGSPAVRAQYAAADYPGEDRNHQESEQESEPEVEQLTPRARLGGERAAGVCQRFDQSESPCAASGSRAGIIASP